MKEKAYDPARHNEEAPAPGMAGVNTHNPGEERDANHERDVPEGERLFDEEEARRQEEVRSNRESGGRH